MGCLYCSHIRLAEEDADAVAINDLTRQIRAATDKRLIRQLRATRGQLQVEASLERGLRRALRKSKREVVAAVKAAAERGGLEELRRMRRDEMSAWLLDQGLAESVFEVTDAERETLANVEELLLTSVDGFDIAAVGGIGSALAQDTVEGIFDDVTLPDTQRAVRDALSSAEFSAEPSAVISSLDAALRSAEGRQITEARTRLTSFGRELTAVAAEAAGLDHYLYTGPLDGITRSFCRELVGKVFTSSQIGKMRNDQLEPVLTRGGGYNCRHSWSPVSEELIDSANLERGTDAEVRSANEKARRAR
jgi:hypothetical protein